VTSECPRTISAVRVGVVDVGSNTVRLLVADARSPGRVDTVHERRAFVGLGIDVDRLGWISSGKLSETIQTVREYAAAAREVGCHDLEVVLTAPGRRSANADELVAALALAARAPVRVLSAEDEARLAFTGALLGVELGSGSVAVCDSGGGSTEVGVGTVHEGPVWVRSLDVGSLTLLERHLPDDPPGKEAVAAARLAMSGLLVGFAPPLPQSAFATGGTARALRRVVGRRLGADELDCALRKLAKRPAAQISAEFGVAVERARTLPAGAIILAEVQRRLGVPLRVSRKGMREGVAVSLLAKLAAA
jgi:exopolyphosphatase / guanosine-5'-triphosphate,3'-diphosphate pyrophosphatase